MENTSATKRNGFVFQGSDIKKILEDATPWLKVEENQDFFIYGMDENLFPTGTRVNAKIVGIQGDIDENYVDMLFERVAGHGANGELFSVPVKVATTKDVVREKFDIPYVISGTYATIDGDNIDILNDEEREFKTIVDDMLGERNDKYAELFRKNNVKGLGDRELILLHKIKAEMKHSEVLKGDIVTPTDLITYFIETTAEYIQTSDELEQLLEGFATLLESGKEGLKTEADVRAMEKDGKVLENRINMMKDRNKYFSDVINQVILPVLA